MKKTNLKILVMVLIISFTSAISLAQTNEIQVNQAENAQIVFYRLKKAKGAAIKFNIENISKEFIGNLKNGSVIKET